MADLLPPCDIEAERAVVCAALLSPDALGVVRDTLQPVQFFDPTCRIVIEAAYAADDDGQAIDVVTIATRIRAGGKWEAIGGGPTLASLFAASPEIGNVADHCKIVADKSKLRRIIDVCRLHAVAAQGDVGDVAEYCATVERDIMTATDFGTTADAPQTIGELVSAEVQRVQDAQNPDAEAKPVGIQTGIYELDQACSGGLDDYLYVVAGRPGMGKTAFALSLLRNVARNKKTNRRSGVFFSLEMDKPQLAQRMLANTSGVPVNLLKGQKLHAEQWKSVLAAKQEVSGLPISIHYKPGAHMTSIRSTLRREFARHRRDFGTDPGLAVIDYLSLVQGNRSKGDGREAEVASVSRYLMTLPAEFHCPIILLAQLNRELEKRPNKRPILADLRESGAVEQDAYSVMFLYRDEYYHPETEDPGIVEVIIAKARNDSTETVRCKFDGPCVRFASEHEDLHDLVDDIDGVIGGF